MFLADVVVMCEKLLSRAAGSSIEGRPGGCRGAAITAMGNTGAQSHPRNSTCCSVMEMFGIAMVRYLVPDYQHQEGRFWKCLLLGMLWLGCLAQNCAVVAITPVQLFRVIFGMSKAPPNQ